MGFTGSRLAGLTLVAAAARPVPIPVFAEMSSINPVFLLPGALAARAETMGTAFTDSLTRGAGQYCANPGLIVAVDGPDLDAFVATAAQALTAASASTMLTPAIAASYRRGVAEFGDHATIEARGVSADGPNACRPALFSTDAVTFLASGALRQEVFGASSQVVRCRDAAEMITVARSLEGQLTATLHLEQSDHHIAHTPPRSAPWQSTGFCGRWRIRTCPPTYCRRRSRRGIPTTSGGVRTVSWVTTDGCLPCHAELLHGRCN